MFYCGCSMRKSPIDFFFLNSIIFNLKLFVLRKNYSKITQAGAGGCMDTYFGLRELMSV